MLVHRVLWHIEHCNCKWGSMRIITSVYHGNMSIITSLAVSIMVILSDFIRTSVISTLLTSDIFFFFFCDKGEIY